MRLVSFRTVFFSPHFGGLNGVTFVVFSEGKNGAFNLHKRRREIHIVGHSQNHFNWICDFVSWNQKLLILLFNFTRVHIHVQKLNTYY